ncbi:YraN family protein [Geotalea toluenoxydans]|uniref:YraN family protein n=1 Tax=Geotalea toluenoxydans TaxID=421624 RepID=UPI0006D09735|nr:YraN family protein [Geotalea toluenoxydans]
MKGEGKSDNKTLGEVGESIAVTFLKGLKYTIIERNFRCKCGEIDIIARDGKTLVFVEVKTRRTNAFGVPQLAVTPFKQRQISKTALTWLAQKKLQDAGARFDVIAILQPDHAVPEIDHIRDAFDLAY